MCVCLLSIMNSSNHVVFSLLFQFTSVRTPFIQGGDPVRVGVAMTDLTTGLYAYGSVMAAILEREKTGLGQKVDCNLISSQVKSRLDPQPSLFSQHMQLTRQMYNHRLMCTCLSWWQHQRDPQCCITHIPEIQRCGID